MQQIIELIEGENIITYQLQLEENASKELSFKLKNLSELRRVRYDMI